MEEIVQQTNEKSNAANKLSCAGGIHLCSLLLQSGPTVPGAGLIEYARQLLSVVYSSPSLNLLETHIKLICWLVDSIPDLCNHRREGF